MTARPAKPPFEAVVERYQAMVLRVTRAVLGPHDADDAWSETFLAALRAYPQLPADANVEAWLVTIAHRKALDVVRATRRRAAPVGTAPHDSPVAAGPPPPASAENAVTTRLDLVAALERLSPRQRQALAYHFLGGLPYEQVAAVIGGTAAAARRAAADGIAALRRMTGREDE